VYIDEGISRKALSVKGETSSALRHETRKRNAKCRTRINRTINKRDREIGTTEPRRAVNQGDSPGTQEHETCAEIAVPTRG
jgi:hypothetical protein